MKKNTSDEIEELKKRLARLEVIVNNSLGLKPKKPLYLTSVANIQKIVALKSGLPCYKLVNPGSTAIQSVNKFRMLAMSLCQHYTSSTMREIAEKFSLTSHGNVYHAKRRWAYLITVHPELQKFEDECVQAIQESFEQEHETEALNFQI